MEKALKVEFCGANRSVTGSRHLIHVGDKRILLECGLVQGRRKEAERLNRELPFDVKGLDAVVLSHAHIDHSGNLPSLVKHGYKGRVHCTRATADLIEIMLRDSANIQERDAFYLNKKRKPGDEEIVPLYDKKDAERLLELVAPERYRQDFEVVPGVSCRFLDAGHILGSAIVCLEIERDDEEPLRLVFSGDLGRKNLPILKDPEPVKEADVLIMESTYGDRLHDEIRQAEEKLGKIVARTAERGGKVIIPSFSVGRSQEIVYELHNLIEAGDIPDLPIYIDSPLTAKASKIFAEHQECFDEETWEILREGGSPFGFGRMTYIKDVEASKALNRHEGPCVIISASGMAEAGRILHHLKNSVEDPRNTILIVGFQASHTLGRRLAEGHEAVRIFGREYMVKAEVQSLHGYSAHADRDDLLEFVKGIDPSPAHVFLVHGEESQSLALADTLRDLGLPKVTVPETGQRFPLA